MQIATESKGDKWSIETSSAGDYVPKKIISNSSTNHSLNQNYTNFNNEFNENWEENSYQRLF